MRRMGVLNARPHSLVPNPLIIPTSTLYKTLHKRYLSGSILLPYPRPHAPNSILKPYNMLPETISPRFPRALAAYILATLGM